MGVNPPLKTGVGSAPLALLTVDFNIVKIALR